MSDKQDPKQSPANWFKGDSYLLGRMHLIGGLEIIDTNNNLGDLMARDMPHRFEEEDDQLGVYEVEGGRWYFGGAHDGDPIKVRLLYTVTCHSLPSDEEDEAEAPVAEAS